MKYLGSDEKTRNYMGRIMMPGQNVEKNLRFRGDDPVGRVKCALLALGVFDFCVKTVLQKELGRERTQDLREKMWSNFFEINTERYKRELGGKEVDIPMAGLMMKRLQEENFSVYYDIEENTPYRHVGYIKNCPLWADEDALLENALGDRIRKEYTTFENVYDVSQLEVATMIRKLGLEDHVSSLMDNCVCLGGDRKLGCRIIFERNKNDMASPPLPRHCDEPMQVVGAKVKCLICGQTQPYLQYEKSTRASQPRHCGELMAILTVLECRACGTHFDFQGQFLPRVR